jgi:hypothetical protein
LTPHGEYTLPGELARHAPEETFSPDELREARFRAAAEMVEMWRGLDLPAWVAPYALRDARLGYLNGYERTLLSGELSEDQIVRAAEARWGERWQERLAAARNRAAG